METEVLVYGATAAGVTAAVAAARAGAQVVLLEPGLSRTSPRGSSPTG